MESLWVGETYVRAHKKTIGGKDFRWSAHCRKVKILMMTESSFNWNASATTHDRPGSAIGLMQITTFTHKLIQPESSELRDHSFKVTRKDLSDPNVNISVGVRWLFRKREIAKYYLKSEPTMLQLAEEYKGLRGDKSVNAEKIRIKFKQKIKEYQNGKIGN